MILCTPVFPENVYESHPDPVYLVELESNSDAPIPQSCLRLVEG
jgi:hypothetical protein